MCTNRVFNTSIELTFSPFLYCTHTQYHTRHLARPRTRVLHHRLPPDPEHVHNPHYHAGDALPHNPFPVHILTLFFTHCKIHHNDRAINLSKPTLHLKTRHHSLPKHNRHNKLLIRPSVLTTSHSNPTHISAPSKPPQPKHLLHQHHLPPTLQRSLSNADLAIYHYQNSNLPQIQLNWKSTNGSTSMHVRCTYTMNP